MQRLTINTYGGVGGTAPGILNLGTRRMGEARFMPRDLLPAETFSSAHWTGGWMGSETDLGALEKIKISSHYPGIEAAFLSHPAPSSDTTPT